jgi:transposase-like protein
MSNKKYDQDKLDKAKELYMDFVPVAEIAREIGIPRTGLMYWVKNYWKEERNLKGTELFQELSESKAANFARMLKSSEKVVANYLRSLENKDEVTPQEVKVAMQVITELDKITRLDKAEPTEIIANQEKVVSSEDILKKLQTDPFAKLKESDEDAEKKSKTIN